MIICNGKIMTMNGPIIEKGYIKTAGKTITEIGPMESLTDSGDTRLDVSGMFVMPGIIDAHSHIGITEEKKGVIGDDCNECTNPVTPSLRAIDAINPMDAAFHEAIAAGITGVLVGPGSANVIGGQFAFIKTHGRCIDDMIVKAPAAMKAALGENPKVCYGDQNKYPSTRMANAAILRNTLRKAQLYNPDDGFDADMEAMLPVIRREIPLKVHAHRADDILTAIRIAKEFHINITLDHCTEGHLIVEHIKKSGFPAIVGTDLTSKNKIEVANMSFKTCGVLNSAGILTAITTDHPVALIQYLSLCAGLSVRAGLPMEDAFKAITINPAKICGVDMRVGSLEVGKDADIAVFDGNPMNTFTNTIYTVIDGNLVYSREEHAFY
ncbi:MAG: amidohydrolase [Clostridium sp.]|nr:amidohydrolase [Clostridium sp.]MCM1397904.1 amidohydrolase [Clostridium sp.]MCM1459142.1 amidohydrolase [Bacteroides sp.]